MEEYTVVYCNTTLHGHTPCWRVWCRTWEWYTRDEFATKDAAKDEAARRNAEYAKGRYR